jgi:UMF1 family MFS transporter
VQRRELFGWAMYDFANSGYTTVVMTAIFNAWFVGAVAGGAGGLAEGTATLLWTSTVAAANLLVLLSAPLVGALGDQSAIKKRLLLVTTVGCVSATALLSLVGPGDYVLAMLIVLLGCVMFASGESLIAAFLPEIASPDHMGRISGYGWSLGYVGGVLTLVLCLGYVQWAAERGLPQQSAIAGSMLITALLFALAATPTFLFLRERALPQPRPAPTVSLARAVFTRLGHTLREVQRFRDLRRLLLTITVYQSGVITVVVLAAVYAQEAMGFGTEQLLVLIIVVNITSAVGAFLFGFFQDRIGSVRALGTSLAIWSLAVTLAFFADREWELWIVGNLVGLAMGASQSIGRALVGQFTPVQRTGEFFGLWGLANRLSALIGPMSYGLVTYLSDGNHRLAILSTLVFFLLGLWLLQGVDARRGMAAAN